MEEASVVRGKWYKSWKALFYSCLATTVICWGAAILFNDNQLFITGSRVLLAIGWLLCCYHCAYKKPGTKLLTYILLITFADFGRCFLALQKCGGAIELLICGFYMVLLGRFFCTSMDLWSLNRQVQKKTLKQQQLGCV